MHFQNQTLTQLISLLLIFQMLIIHWTVKGMCWNERKGNRSACVSTAATVLSEGKGIWAKPNFTSDNTKEVQHQDCDNPAGKGRASWCLFSLCLPGVFCICKWQPVLLCLEKRSRDSWLSITCLGIRQQCLLKSCRNPESSHLPSKAGQCNIMYYLILFCFKDFIDMNLLSGPGKNKVCYLSVYFLTNCSKRVWGEGKEGRKLYFNFIGA